MTTQSFDIIFRGSIDFAAAPSEWWKDAAAFEALRNAMESTGLWLDLPYMGRRGAKGRPTPEPAKVAAWSKRWKLDQRYALSRDSSGSLEDTTLTFTPREDGLQFYFLIRGADADAQRRTFLDGVTAFARDVRKRNLFGGVRLGGWQVLLSRDYPTPRPLLYPKLWSAGVLLMIVDREHFVEFSNFKEQAATELAQVLAAPLPPGAKREDDGPLAIFRFIDDLTDDAAVDRARGVQHAWISSNVASEAGAFSNEHGDARVFVLSPTNHPPLTLYDATNKHGYKAVFLTDDGGGDADLDEAAQWLAAKQLPDGTPVLGISIVAPGRDAAIEAVERVRKRGFNRLLYVDNNGEFWDPFAVS